MDVQSQRNNDGSFRSARVEAEFVVRGSAPAIALLSAVALTLLDLRDASRRDDAQTRPATTVVSHDYVAVLTAWRYGEVRLKIRVHDFYYALARLVGHQNRNHDKRPGWLVLWRGWAKLQAMLDGYLTAQRKRCG